ncbi:hypothetical protein [Brevundimonas sp. TWP3-1-2b1]|uniref:hypothetical protein n=1 Tax=Brevundimonas sp. TWP3-1-2b1 TaxID=2804650 RepID=UPI003CF4E946
MTESTCLIATIGKNASEEVRVVLDTYKAHRLCDMRVFASFSAAAVPMPTRKGLSVQVSLLPDLIEALTAARDQAVALGWLEVKA